MIRIPVCITSSCSYPKVAAEKDDSDLDHIESLLEPLRELQGRFRLEVPEEYVKEERIRESSDQQTATLLLTWYDTENKSSYGDDVESLNLEPIIDELAEAVLGSKDELTFQTAHKRRGRHTFVSAVKVQFKPDAKHSTAGFRREGQDIVPPDTYPVTIYIGDNVFGIESDDGVTYRTTKNGEALEDSFESAPDAIGSLISPVIKQLMDLEASKGRDDQLVVEQDFLVGIAEHYLNSDTISEDAKEHLVTFVELVTNRDLISTLEHQHEDDATYEINYEGSEVG